MSRRSVGLVLALTVVMAALWLGITQTQARRTRRLNEHVATLILHATDGMSRSRDSVTPFLDRGASIHTRTWSGETVLMYAASVGSRPLLQRALGAGLDVNETSASGSTALTFAVLQEDPAIIDFLVAQGADVNRYGGRALSAAANRLHLDVVKALIRHAADPRWKHEEGRTVLQEAKAELQRAIRERDSAKDADQRAYWAAEVPKHAAVVRALKAGAVERNREGTTGGE